MVQTVIIDPGHGGNDSGAGYKGYEEKTFNLNIALKVHHYLTERFRVNVLMTRTEDRYVSLEKRTTFANQNNADYFCSIHNNAGGGTGFESYIFEGNVPQKTIQAQDIIHSTIVNEVMEKYGVANRGQKRANFHVLRETGMSAILLEILFIDNDQNLQLLKTQSFINDVSAAIAEGIAQTLSLPPLPDGNEQVLYKVICGSFKQRENALDRVAFLQQQQVDAFITEAEISGDTYYRVQVGAFHEKENAEQRVEQVQKLGVCEPFIVTEYTTNPDPSDNEKITGQMRLDAEQMDQFTRGVNPNAPLLGEYYVEFGKHYNIQGDIAYAQALLETNYFRFTGIVDPQQNNFCGLGATGPGNPGASFPTAHDGVLAHLQHLYAYASEQPLPEGYSLIDPRFDLVNRGSAGTWIALNGKWAVPGDNYGQQILDIYNRMVNNAPPKTDDPPIDQSLLKKLIGQLEKLLNKFKGLLKK